jgi:hypothetical protein
MFQGTVKKKSENWRNFSVIVRRVPRNWQAFFLALGRPRSPTLGILSPVRPAFRSRLAVLYYPSIIGTGGGTYKQKRNSKKIPLIQPYGHRSSPL